MNAQLPFVRATLAITIVCGTAISVVQGQPADSRRPTDLSQPSTSGAHQPVKEGDRDVQKRSMQNGPRVFVSGEKLRGMDVKNSADKTLGEVDDLIIDRGSGRIRYVVMKSGAVLGMGGKHVTVPYDSFGWDSADKELTLASTPDEIKTWPEFNKKNWEEGARSSGGYVRTIGKDYYDITNTPWPTDAKAEKDGTARVQGTVKGFSRQNVGGREELVVIVAPKGGAEQQIILGPSWYVAGNNAIALYRDTPIDVDVFHTTREGNQVAVARTATIDGKNLAFYDSQGRARWAPNSDVSAEDAYAAAPFVLATEIMGKAVDARGEKCGKVKDLVVECTSGKVAFVSIDPDKGFLGVGDENRLIPWSIITRSPDAKVHVDATKAMITSAPTTPADLKSLASEDSYQRIYGIYDTQPGSFEKRR